MCRSIAVLFLLCALTSSVRALWRDPLVNASLEIISNVTSLDVGVPVNYTCISHNFPMDTATLYFTQQLGTNEEHGLYVRGRSPLEYITVLTTADHDTTLMCQSTFSDRNPPESEDHYIIYHYYTRSAVVPLQLASGGTPKPPSAGTASVRISTNVTTSDLSVGDGVQIVCETFNIPYGVLEVYQGKVTNATGECNCENLLKWNCVKILIVLLYKTKKILTWLADPQRKYYLQRSKERFLSAGDYALQLHTSWQSYRELNITVDEIDDGTTLFCQSWLTDPFWNSYSILTEKITLTVR